MITNLRNLLPKYEDKDQAIGAFNVAFFPDIFNIIKAGEEMNSPVIIQISPYVSEFIGYEYWAMMARKAAEKTSIPVVIHLDHASKIDDIWRALDAGYTSVMYDGSQLPVEENIENTRKVIEKAHRYGVSVEAEIGSVAYLGKNTHKDQLSDPIGAKKFAEESGCDCLAVSVGTTHMMRTQTSNIHFDLLQSIQDVVNIPLVIHGSSGLPDEQLIKLRSYHVCKINIGTALRMAFSQGLREELRAHPDDVVTRGLLQKGLDAEKEVVKEKMRLLGFSD